MFLTGDDTLCFEFQKESSEFFPEVIFPQFSNHIGFSVKSSDIFFFNIHDNFPEFADLFFVVGAALSRVLRADEASHVYVDLGGLLLEGKLSGFEDEEEVVAQILLRLPMLDLLLCTLHLIYK